ncbi:respiratory chain complex I subunit 1 family protein [Aeromonas salmonicida]|uniref:respiratory chain complex I subunit 1 family protein n=1 Tax=Aeromonas salmonicida TaxID=645 RepID=UPI00259D7BDE|nr:NADH-quinone oxidoreductase subunit H [Aeromonas salmonicida]MDM5115111.1 NADH-quinone oxidoreductase subunit H [Aeromonas salmonicida]
MPVLEMPSWGMVALALTQAIAMLALAPLATGFNRVLRAKMHSRQGPGPLQDYRDIGKLLRRQEVTPEPAGILFNLMPALLIAALLLVGMALPTLTHESPFPIAGDLITDIYLFAIFRFFSLAGLDSGSMFAGIGARRELTLGILVEPILVLACFIMAMMVGSSDLGNISSYVANQPLAAPIATLLAGGACAFAVFVEMGKLPFDCAEAEQELQEGPLTEYSGAGLALLKLSMGLKQLVVVQLFLVIFLPFGKAANWSLPALAVAALILLCKLLVAFGLAGIIENSMARTQFVRTHKLTRYGLGLALLALLAYLVGV